MMMRVLLLTRYGRMGASSRLRSMQFLPWLRAAGITCTVQPLFCDELLQGKYQAGGYRLGAVLQAYAARVRQLLQRHAYDLIWIEKEALPWLPVWFERALLRGVPYMLDYDDALFHNYDLHSSAVVRHVLGGRIDALMKGARLVVGGNEYLAQRARDAGTPWVEVVPTVIDLDRYRVAPRSNRSEDVPRIVWVGSPSTVRYLADLERPLTALAKRLAFKLRVIGGMLSMPGVDVECLAWSEESEVLSIGQCGVGIMPLADSPWERGKCGYKLIQYMACGLPVVASPIGVNTQIVQDGVNGFLAGDSDAWLSKLEQLLGDVALREAMGQAGRRRVEEEYCVQQIAPRLVNLLLTAGSRQICVG